MWEKPLDTDKGLNVHLMPGKIALFQNNSAQDKFTTKDMNQHKAVQLIVNRDFQNHAETTAFFDDGESLSKLKTEQVEYYNLIHNGMSLLKINLNEKNAYTTLKPNEIDYGFYVDKVVITNPLNQFNNTSPHVLSGRIDTACFIATNGTVFKWNVTHDEYQDTLVIHPRSDQNPADFTFFNMRSIHYLERGVDINHCDPYHDYYYYEGQPDLSSNYAKVEFKSRTETFKAMLMEFRVLESGVLNVKWNYNNSHEALREPFEVPKEIIDVDRTKLKVGAKVSDFVVLTQNAGNAIISIVKQGVKQWEIQGFLLDEFLNYIDSMAYTAEYPMNGIIGALEQVEDTLFLQDGYYSLWSRDDPNTPANHDLPNSNHYAVHPYFMAKSANGWFGVYINNAGAQDWHVANDPIEGEVKLTIKSVTGLGDVFIMLGNSANEVVKLYHNSIVGTPTIPPQWTLGWGQCRYGYQNTSKMVEVIDNYTQYGIPLDNMFSDIDYMDDYKNFEYDEKYNFGDLPTFI